jgi:hypothetical protein
MAAPAPLTVKEVRNPIKRERAERIIAAIQTASSDVYGPGELPDASTVAVGTAVYSIADNAPVYSDGTNWRDAMGTLTS